MKDKIVDAIESADPIEALQNLFSVSYEVAVSHGIGSWTLNQMFSAISDARSEIAAAEEEEENEE
jgi:hypothetical protein